jgi:polyphosphate kinase
MLLPSECLLKGHTPTLFDRELSWIAFNRRLLYEVANCDRPILDRLLKLVQTCVALDEYFMVRIPLLKGAIGSETIEDPTDAPFLRIQAYLRALVARQQYHFAYNLRPQLAQQEIYLLKYADLSDMQRAQCHSRFEDEVAPVLAPLITSPNNPIPDFSNLSLNLAVSLEQVHERHLGWVKVPRVLSRFMILPGTNTPQAWVAIPLEQVIVTHLPALFPDFKLQGCFPFRVTRSADLGTLDSETANLMEMIQESLQQRQQQGQAVRLEVLPSMPAWVLSHLMSHLQLTPEDTYRLSGRPGLSDLGELTRLPRPDLLEPPLEPVLPAALAPQPSPSMLSFVPLSSQAPADLFQKLQERDLLLHFPYHSFAETVEKFVAQAAADPDVLTIKMTLYRTAVDAPIVRSLIAAAKAGKQTVVLVELTAPLDEAINIQWAKSLEKAGAHVVYGVVGFRTHTNLVLIVRREREHLRQYAYIGTGDYLPSRPQPYEDLGLLTSCPQIGVDLSHLFNYLTGCSRHLPYPTLMVAPDQLRSQLQQIIAAEIQQAQAGKPAHLIVKLNLLADPEMIQSLYRASQAGVEIDLIVRGICRLRPGVVGLSDRIRVISILGSYVEHSRILYCLNGGQPQAWIGTADWTPRGLDERIEVMAPLPSSALVTEIRQRLNCWLNDTQHAWILQSDGRYIRRQPAPNTPRFSAQEQFRHWDIKA